MASEERPREWLVWWLSQAECEAISDAPPEWPDELRQEYESRLGRAGRVRLWAPESAGDVRVYPWPSTPIARYLEATSSGGVVFRCEYLPLLACMPGLVTDLWLQRIEVTRGE